MDNNFDSYTEEQTTSKKSKKGNSPVRTILSIIGAIVAIVSIIILIVIFVINSSARDLVCTAPEGSITISYNKATITGYVSSGITYEFEEQRALSEKIGTEQYMKDFEEWFRNNTSGTCVYENK